MLGLINPFVAALAMSGSSLVVTLNALRTGAWKEARR
jgi:Cu2+-exporting ATPase